jgi:Zn-finger nucleic acid-binding protein
MQMTCPKCHGEMRVYERSGVTVDQCTECRGIFLDRGELEKLFEAEATWNTQHAGAVPPRPTAYTPPPPPAAGHGGYAPTPPGYAQPAYAQPGYPQQGYPQPGYHGHYRQHHGHYRKKRQRGGFLGELFD